MVFQAHVMSSAMALLKEFRLSGRLSVMVAMLSATSNRMAPEFHRFLLGPGNRLGAKWYTLFLGLRAERAGQTASHDREPDSETGTEE